MAALLLLSPHEMKAFAASALATITSSSNILFWRTTGSYFSPNSDLSPLLMTWTLGVEEQFYIFLPLLMLLLRKAPWRTQFSLIGGLAALSFVASVWGTAHHPGFAFYLLPTRAWELAAGVLVAMFEANRPHAKSSLPPLAAHGLSILGLVLIGVAIGTLHSTTPFPGYAALLPVLGAVLIIAARQGVVNRLLSIRPMVFIGLVSYSWYLWHWPLLSFARITSYTGISKTVGAVLGLLSFGLAALSYKFVEQPFRKSTTPSTLLFMRYGVVVVLMILPPIVLYVSHGLPQRNGTVQQMETGLNYYFTSDKCLVGESVVHLPLTAHCVPPGPGRAVALIGDSHAGAIAGALRGISRRSGYRLIELDKEDCPALVGVSHFAPYVPRLARECTQFNRERLDYVMHDPSIQAVIVVGFWSKPFRHEKRGERYVADGQYGPAVSEAQSQELLQQGLDGLVGRLEQAGKVVYLVQDNPIFAFNPQQYMRTQLIGPRRVLAGLVAKSTLRYPQGVVRGTELPADQQARELVEKVAAAHPDVHLFDMRSALCTPAGCRFAEGDRTLYVDEGHLDSLGAQIALTGFRLPAN